MSPQYGSQRAMFEFSHINSVPMRERDTDRERMKNEEGERKKTTFINDKIKDGELWLGKTDQKSQVWSNVENRIGIDLRNWAWTHTVVIWNSVPAGSSENSKGRLRGRPKAASPPLKHGLHSQPQTIPPFPPTYTVSHSPPTPWMTIYPASWKPLCKSNDSPEDGKIYQPPPSGQQEQGLGGHRARAGSGNLEILTPRAESLACSDTPCPYRSHILTPHIFLLRTESMHIVIETWVKKKKVSQDIIYVDYDE